MDKINQMSKAFLEGYAVLMGLLFLTFATANQIYTFKQNVELDQQFDIEIEASCTTDAECEQLYGYDMYGTPIEDLPQEIIL